MKNLHGLRMIRIRLLNAGLPEIIYRLQGIVDTFRIRRAVCLKKKLPQTPVVSNLSIEKFELPPLNVFASPAVVKKILHNHRFTLNFPDHEIRIFEKQWSQTCWTSVPMGTDTLDIRAVWEAGRLQHITLICARILWGQAGTLQDEYEEWIKREILVWLDQNPFLHGPHYLSAMECGLRIIAFLHCLKTLWHKIGAEEQQRLLDAVYLHAWWVSRRISLYSSLGNHTIAECAGLAAAGLLFRETGTGKEWLNRAVGLLVQETSHQIRDDGGPAEESLNYHRFVLDLLWWVTSACTLNGFDYSDAFLPCLERGERFWNSLKDNFGNIPSAGDSDDGCAIAPGIYPKRKNVPGLLFKKENPVVTFSQTGFSMVQCGKGGVLGLDHGDLGMKPLYNHGHADALSVILHVHGRRILVDPGTYRYNDVPEWRRYFKGTSAHNTVTVDGEDQAVQETGFIWSNPFEAELLYSSFSKDSWILKARHNGYQRLKFPVIHNRDIAGDCAGNIVIMDTFTGEGRHTFNLHFHLHPESLVSQSGECVKVQRKEATLWIKIFSGDTFEIVKGSKDPVLGWYSKGYGIKEPAPVLLHSRKGEPGHIKFITVMCISKTEPETSFFIKLLNRLK